MGPEEKVGERRRMGQTKGPTVVVRAWPLYEEAIIISTVLSKVRLKFFYLKIFLSLEYSCFTNAVLFSLNNKVYPLHAYICPLPL